MKNNIGIAILSYPWKDKVTGYWLFPIPQEEIDKIPKIIQNGSFQSNVKQ
ncbi:MAG: RagB/SusD family nutrient uptake outer membrane protein [Mariniphaga sp.]|nr:RagB/SusD family nutrient uptake outer membrane protein [Mariniphaga sp.]